MADDSNARGGAQAPVLGFRRFSPIALCRDADGHLNHAALSALLVAGRLYCLLRLDVDIARMATDAEQDVQVRSFDLGPNQLGQCLDDVRGWLDETQKRLSAQWFISAALASVGWSRVVLPDGAKLDDLTWVKAPDVEGLQTRSPRSATWGGALIEHDARSERCHASARIKCPVCG